MDDDGNGNENNFNGDDYYYEYYGYDVSFDSYVVTTVNPGIYLLAATFALCVLCFVIGYFALPGRVLNPTSEKLQNSIRTLNTTTDSFKVKESDHFEDDGVELLNLTSDIKKRSPDPSFHYEEMSATEVEDTAMSSSQESVEEADDDWKQTIDKETGKSFYYNPLTLTSTWTKPNVLNGKEKTEKSRRLQILQQRRMLKAKSERILASKERAHALKGRREKSFVVRRRFHKHTSEEDDNTTLQWGDFFGLGVSTKFEQERPMSAPSRMMDTENAYHFFDVFESKPNLSIKEKSMKKRVWKETRKIIGLGLPWMFQSIVADGSSIVTIMIISHYMGLKEMICYSNVWFVVYTAFLINDAWYDTVYKHVNVSAAVGTPEAYQAAGKYVKIGVIGDFILALPPCILAVIYMPAILTWIGYDPSIAAISQSYAIIAVANNMFDSAMGLIDCILDIEGHAKFTAVFEFWDSLASTGLAFYFVKTCRPSLWQLGLFHLASDVIATAIYFIMTGYFKCWFNEYREGLRAPMSSVRMIQLKKLVKMTLPLTVETMMGNVEYTVLTIFAAYQGTAEAATWVLLSYVWSTVGIAPDSFGAASSCHVARILGSGEAELAEHVSWHALKVGTFVSTICSILLFVFRKQFVWCFSLDDTIEQMLSELIPYITLCQPFFTIGWTAMELNDALHLFKRAMVSNTLVTIVIIIPAGYFMTYALHYNLEGIAAAQCVGYTAGGVANVIFLAKADWDKAVRKANDISDVLKKDLEIEEEKVGHYDDYDWEEMPIEARAAATVLGYDQDKWDNAIPLDIVDYDKFTFAQRSSADILGYTKEMYESWTL